MNVLLVEQQTYSLMWPFPLDFSHTTIIPNPSAVDFLRTQIACHTPYLIMQANRQLANPKSLMRIVIAC
jgi:hypothetical protein